jgi:cell division protein FtsB
MSSRDHAGPPGKEPRSARFGPTGVSFTYFILLIVASLLVAYAVAGDSGLLTMMRAKRQYDELAISIASVRQENARLREEIRRLREDPSFIEEIARRELGLIRPGEKVFIIRDIAPPKKQPPSPPRPDAVPQEP